MSRECLRPGAYRASNNRDRRRRTDRLIHVKLGFSAGSENIWVLDYGVTLGDPREPMAWKVLANAISAPRQGQLPVSCVSVDAGYLTNVVMAECKARLWVPTVGRSGGNMAIARRMAPSGLCTVGKDRVNDLWSARLATHKVRFPTSITLSDMTEMCASQSLVSRAGQLRWVRQSADHYWDAAALEPALTVLPDADSDSPRAARARRAVRRLERLRIVIMARGPLPALTGAGSAGLLVAAPMLRLIPVFAVFQAAIVASPVAIGSGSNPRPMVKQGSRIGEPENRARRSDSNFGKTLSRSDSFSLLVDLLKREFARLQLLERLWILLRRSSSRPGRSED